MFGRLDAAEISEQSAASRVEAGSQMLEATAEVCAV